jgi:hypothetical protein
MAKKAKVKAGSKREVIKLLVEGIVVTLNHPDESAPGSWDYDSCSITSDLRAEVPEDEIALQAGLHAIESMILAHAAAGVDIQSPDYVEGLETAIQACHNEL